MERANVKEKSTEVRSKAKTPIPNPALQRLDVLLGTWNIKGRVPGEDGEVSGQAIFEWLPGKFFLEQRFYMSYLGQRVEGIEIIGYDASTKAFTSSVYGNLGSSPPYQWDVLNNVVTHSTEGSYYRGTFSSDGNTLAGRWEPEKGKECSSNVAYDVTMTRVKDQQTQYHGNKRNP